MDGWMDGNENMPFLCRHTWWLLFIIIFLLLVVTPQPAPEFYGVPKKPFFFFSPAYTPNIVVLFLSPALIGLLYIYRPSSFWFPPFRFYGIITIFDIPVEQENHWTIIFFGLTIYHIRHHAPLEEEICLIFFDLKQTPSSSSSSLSPHLRDYLLSVAQRSFALGGEHIHLILFFWLKQAINLFGLSGRGGCRVWILGTGWVDGWMDGWHATRLGC